jgi:hypothetical protein
MRLCDVFSAICGGKVYRHMWLGAFKRSHELFLKFVETSEGRSFLKGYPREVYAFALESEAHLNTITDMLLSEMSEHYQKVIKTLSDNRFPKPHF